MQAGGPFEIVWHFHDRELARKTITCADMDAAVTAAWLDMPDVARAARAPCSAITVRDTASGRSITDDVVHHPPSNRGIVQALTFLACGGIGLLVMVWLTSRGFLKADLEGMTWYIVLAIAFGILFAVIAMVLGSDARREDAERWQKDFGDIAPPSPTGLPRFHRIVVAHFSPWVTIFTTLMLFAGAVAAFWFPMQDRLSSGGWALANVVSLGLSAWLFCTGLVPLRQLLANGRAALWIEGGRIVYGDALLGASRSIIGIKDVAMERYEPDEGFPYRAIIITGQDGGKQPIAHRLLSQDADAVVARLKQLLRLPAPDGAA